MTESIALTAVASDEKLVWTAPTLDIVQADRAETGPYFPSDGTSGFS